MEIIEFYYWITNKPYFEVIILSKMNRKIGRFVQLASDTKKGRADFLCNYKLKLSWFKPEYPVLDGLKFKTFVKDNNAIPLMFEDTLVIETGEYINTEKTIRKIKQDTNKKAGTGLPEKFVEINYPPALLHQEVECRFVSEINSEPPSKWEEQKWIWIVLILAGAFLVYTFMGRMI